jgi:hypothetical protein
MKKILAIISCFFLTSFSLTDQKNDSPLSGAWEWRNGNEVHTVIFSDKFYALTEYNVTDKKFITTRGGTWKITGKNLVLMEEFNSAAPGDVGKETTRPLKLAAGKMTVSLGGKKEVSWTRLDSGEPGKLAGAWLITGRMVDDTMQTITPGVRRTMKILSGTRFQWIAYNTETREFFGTGGGTYTTEDGKYRENIDFFSRDNSRVGKSLDFEFSLENGNWRHKGFSSKGDPIDEVWTRRELLAL